MELYLECPCTSFPRSFARDYRETYPYPPPSTLYGLLLSLGFQLPHGAIRSPDVAWVAKERWRSLSPKERRGFAPLCPDFVIELVSPTAALDTLQTKMHEYIANGCRLGWLIASEQRFVEIYRPNCPVEHRSLPTELSGEAVLVNFTLKID